MTRTSTTKKTAQLNNIFNFESPSYVNYQSIHVSVTVSYLWMTLLLHKSDIGTFRLLLTRENKDCYLLIMDVVKQVIKAAQENIENERAKITGIHLI